MQNTLIKQKNFFPFTLSFIVGATITVYAQPLVALDLDLYGVAHLSVDSNDDGNDSQVFVASNSSRLGVRAKHDIGNGLTVGAQYESGVDLTGRGNNDGNGPGTSNNLFSTSRDAFVSLGGGFGTVKAGRMGVLNQWVYDYNLFADQVGDLGNIWGGTGIPGRDNGMIAYTTPKLGMGLQGTVSYIPESGTNNADTVVLKGDFNNGSGMKLGAGYMNRGNGNFAANAQDHTAYALTGSYDIGVFSIGGGYQNETDIGGVNGNDRDSYTLGGSYKLGRSTLKAQFTNSSADAANQDADMTAVGVDYSLNKATTLYAAYATTNNDPAAAFTANNYGHGQAVSPAVGEDPSSFSVGLVYKFDAKLLR